MALKFLRWLTLILILPPPPFQIQSQCSADIIVFGITVLKFAVEVAVFEFEVEEEVVFDVVGGDGFEDGDLGVDALAGLVVEFIFVGAVVEEDVLTPVGDGGVGAGIYIGIVAGSGSVAARGAVASGATITCVPFPVVLLPW